LKSVGEILKNERLKQGLAASQIASAIKTKEKNILGIEANDFSVFPGDVYALSYVRDYADFLGLNPDEIAPFFRRTVEMKRQISPKENLVDSKTEYFINQKLDSAGKNISKAILTVGTLIVISLFVGFLIFEYQRNILHPQLEIQNPKEDLTTNSKVIEILGKTDSDNKIFINGEEIPVDEKGIFKTILNLKIGLNKITFKAVNNYQKLTEIEKYVLRKK
jgi:cytoskeletal protein RodZ